MEPLTDKQHNVLDAILGFHDREDRPPTTRELAALLGRHQKTVCQHLDALESKGYIERRDGYIRAAEELRHRDGFPLVGRVAAGAPILAVENLEGYLSLEDVFGRNEGKFALRVRGDSMIDAHICDGDYVIVRQQPELPNGEIGVVTVNDEATVKRVYVSGSAVRLVPENPAFQPLEFDTTQDEVRIIGKVVGLIRRTDL